MNRLLLLTLFCAAPLLAQGPPPAPVRVDALRTEKLTERRFVTGELRSARRARVAGREPGLLLEVNGREGEQVRAGDLLARVDASKLKLERAQLDADDAVTKALLAERKADLEYRKWQLSAYEKLAAKGSGIERERREAMAMIATAKARILQAEKQLTVTAARRALLERRIEDTEVRAPFDAIVLARLTEKGEWLAVGGAVIELVATGGPEAWFDVPEALAPALAATGTAIQVRIAAANIERKIKSWRVLPQVNARTRTFPVILALTDASGTVLPGMSARAWIPTAATTDHLTLAKDAILRNEAGPYVYAVRATGGEGPAVVALVRVELLFAVGDRYAVRAPGLTAQDTVVVEGNERLSPGAPVVPLPNAAKPGTAKRD